MKIYLECSLTNFEPWSGAKYAYNILTHEQLGELEQNLECIYPDGIDETELNDLFWFEEDFLAEMLGFEDFKALERFNNGEEEEEEAQDVDSLELHYWKLYGGALRVYGVRPGRAAN